MSKRMLDIAVLVLFAGFGIFSIGSLVFVPDGACMNISAEEFDTVVGSLQEGPPYKPVVYDRDMINKYIRSECELQKIANDTSRGTETVLKLQEAQAEFALARSEIYEFAKPGKTQKWMYHPATEQEIRFWLKSIADVRTFESIAVREGPVECIYTAVEVRGEPSCDYEIFGDADGMKVVVPGGWIHEHKRVDVFFDQVFVLMVCDEQVTGLGLPYALMECGVHSVDVTEDDQLKSFNDVGMVFRAADW